MEPFPHHYRVTASGGGEPGVRLEAGGVPTLRSDAPPEFGGPGDRWSPETLLVAAVADCFVLTFRAIASASKLEWTALTCDVEGTLDRVERVPQFTRFTVDVSLRLPGDVEEDRARRLLEKAEHACLIANSLKARMEFHATVVVPALAG